MTKFGSAMLVVCLCTIFVLTTAPASATTVQYFDQTTWSNATTGVTSIGFEGTGANQFATRDYSNSTGYMVSGVDFVGLLSAGAYALAVVDANYLGGPYNFDSGASLRGPWYTTMGSPTIHVTLPANTTAVATNLATVSPYASDFQITLSDGSTYDVSTLAKPNLAFFGFTSDSSIAYMDFAVIGPAGSTNYGLLDNFQFGSNAAPPADTPEAATMILIGSGLVFLNGIRKRQARRSHRQNKTLRLAASVAS